MTKPVALTQAELMDGLCRRYGQPLSVMKREPAQETMHMLWLVAEGSEQADG